VNLEMNLLDIFSSTIELKELKTYLDVHPFLYLFLVSHVSPTNPFVVKIWSRMISVLVATLNQTPGMKSLLEYRRFQLFYESHSERIQEFGICLNLNLLGR
jgi:hypothetical protein